MSSSQTIPASCPKCRTSLSAGQTFCPTCGCPLLDQAALSATPQVSPPSTAIPWETAGTLQSFFKTLGEALFTPNILFDKVRFAEGRAMPLLFAVIMGSIHVLFRYFWSTLDSSSLLLWSREPFSNGQPGPVTLLLTPVFTVLAVALTALYLHALVTVTRSRKEGINAMFRTVCYAQAANAAVVIPVLGNVAVMIWGVVLVVVGISKVHRISKLRSSAIVLLPGFMLGIMVAFLVVAAVLAGLATGSFLQELISLYR